MESSINENNTQEILSVFAWFAKKSFMNHFQILELPHSVYLAYNKHFYIDDLKQTEEGREYLAKVEKFNNPRTKADLSAIRNFGGYTPTSEGGE